MSTNTKSTEKATTSASAERARKFATGAAQWNTEALGNVCDEMIARMRANRAAGILALPPKPLPETQSDRPYGWGDLWR